MISLFTTLALMNEWDIDPQTIFVGGGVTAVIIGIALSTIVGNILSGGLVLTTFPAKIGDSILIVNDNLRGRIDEVNLLYTKIITDQGSEYFVPNNAVIQGNIRLIKEEFPKLIDELPFSIGDCVEFKSPNCSYTGTVNGLTSKFISLAPNPDVNLREILIPRAAILSGQYVILRDKATPPKEQTG
jgi:small-conductance mechanosensitive channel